MTLGLVRRQPSLDFFLPEKPGLPIDADAMLLPAALVERCLRRMMEGDLQLVKALASVFQGNRLFQVESPPPMPSAHIVQHQHNFAPMIERSGVSPFDLRYKLWRVQSHIAREHGVLSNSAFIETPFGVQDDDGSLKEAYRRPPYPRQRVIRHACAEPNPVSPSSSEES